MVALPNKLYGDEVRFAQVLVNLVRNALKFTRGGEVRVLMAFDAETASMWVHVQDDGLGISAEDQERIFALDTRVEENTELNKDGLGMGLAICRSIVNVYNGSIKVMSDGLGKGSCFTFSMEMEAVTTA